MYKSDNDLIDPPLYDMLNVKFRGDIHELYLPYCEVGNGDVTDIDKNSVTLITLDDAAQEPTTLPFKDFFKMIEQTFDTKEIVGLWLQKAGAYEKIKIS
jgi:hypothetical protein